MVELCAFEMSDPSSKDTWTEFERLFAQHPMTYDHSLDGPLFFTTEVLPGDPFEA